MRRREFISLLGGAAMAPWPHFAVAQQSAMQVIGWLDSKGPIDQSSPLIAAFRNGLREAGLVEGSNLAIDFRFADNQPDRLPTLAADLVRRRVAVIVAIGLFTTPAAKAATSTVPIIFYSGGDPVEAGHVSSLNRPSGNVTGVSVIYPALNPKRFELLHELVPRSAVIAVLWDPTRNADAQLSELEAAAHVLGRRIIIVRAGSENEIGTAFTTIAQSDAGALFVGTGPLYNSQRRKIVALAARHALPASYHLRDAVVDGGLMSYGANEKDAHRRLGVYVGRILKGEKPGDLPVELPTKYELVINLGTARKLKLEIPPRLRALADEVIE
jgi:putative tryptophan/tyrosine transport system substrate-binding protein